MILRYHTAPVDQSFLPGHGKCFLSLFSKIWFTTSTGDRILWHHNVLSSLFWTSCPSTWNGNNIWSNQPNPLLALREVSLKSPACHRRLSGILPTAHLFTWVHLKVLLSLTHDFRLLQVKRWKQWNVMMYKIYARTNTCWEKPGLSVTLPSIQSPWATFVMDFLTKLPASQ